MKTIALEDKTYQKLSKLKYKISELRNISVNFNELVEETLRRPMGPLLIDDLLRESIISLTKELSRDDSVVGVIIYGSVVKGNFQVNSDVDFFVISTGSLSNVFDFVESTIQKVESQFSKELTSHNLPATFSPLIVSQSETETLRPIFFDVADSGIILYDRFGVATSFVERYLSIPHKREYTKDGEILTW
jgi:predicted nucleotidyltransferase